MSGRKRVFHVISNTHWDREWRFPFQKNRQMLVEMIDQVLDILENEPDYRAFHLDSQTVVVKDYLEIRPQKKELIRRLVGQRRLFIGPWYILPDEFLVGGESLVRNLLLGHKIAREFGHVMKVGYSPFSWGQISQLPQIYKEFGIEVIMFYRGINSLESEKAEFIWEGADGTRVLSSRFSTMPRYNFYFYIYRPVIHNEQITDVEYKWSRGGAPVHFADPQLREGDYQLLQHADNYYHENLQPAVEAIIEKQVNDFTTPHIFWAEGHDSSGPNIRTVQIIRDLQKLLPGDLVKHSTLEEYAQGLLQDADWSRLAVVKGERRSSQYDLRSTNLYGYTTSTRMYLKQKQFECEKWLQFYAEPFRGFADLSGFPAGNCYLELAWDLLLQNTAHDSIGGCSLDTVHEDMMHRYRQVLEITQGVFERAVRNLVSGIDLKKYKPDSLHLVAVNPGSENRDEVVEAFLDIPVELDKTSFRIIDQDQKEIPVQLLDKSDVEPVLEQLTDRPMFLRMKRYHCYMELKKIPAWGYKTFHILPGRTSVKSLPVLAKTIKGQPCLENRFLKVMINRNGTLQIVHKETKKVYDQVGYFFDEGEAGHAWVHKPVKPYFDTLRSRPEIKLVTRGPLVSIYRITHKLKLPTSLKDRRKKNKNAHLPITMEIKLQKDCPYLEFHIDLVNDAEDHRLRLMFPSNLHASASYAEGGFDVVARSTDRPDTRDWVEQPMYDYPLHHFVDVSDGKNGMAVFVQGLKEYEVLNDDRRTLALTLVRAFAYTIQPSSVQDYSHQKGSQCPGHQYYRLALYPHHGDWQKAGVYQEALKFNNELCLVQAGRTEGEMPEEIAFLRIEPPSLIFSCFKEPEQVEQKVYIVRVYNPTEESLSGTFTCFFTVLKIEKVTLEETFMEDVQAVQENRFPIQVEPKKICTYKLHFK